MRFTLEKQCGEKDTERPSRAVLQAMWDGKGNGQRKSAPRGAASAVDPARCLFGADAMDIAAANGFAADAELAALAWALAWGREEPVGLA